MIDSLEIERTLLDFPIYSVFYISRQRD